MNTLKIYKLGIKKATAEKKMMFLLWVVNIAFASAVYFLVSGYVGKALGNSQSSEALLKRFDFGFVLEMLIHEGGPVLNIALAAFILAALYFWTSVFLNGGILFSLIESGRSDGPADRKRPFMPLFFEGAGKYFGRFFRLTLYTLLLWLVSILIFLLLNAVTKPMMASGLNEKAVFYVTLIKVILALFLFFLIRMILDYARIAIVTEDSRYVFRALFQAVGFVGRRIGSTLGLYYVLLLTGMILFAVFWVLNKFIPTDSYFPIMLSFLVGQIFILSRGWLKITFQTSQLRLYSLKR